MATNWGFAASPSLQSFFFLLSYCVVCFASLGPYYCRTGGVVLAGNFRARALWLIGFPSNSGFARGWHVTEVTFSFFFPK